MTTTVNRVYVDAEGVVRMSPTGWPTEPIPGWGSVATQKYITSLLKAREESIPFEDQQWILTVLYSKYGVDEIGRPVNYFYWKENLKPDFYTIEPIQVELVEVMSEGWMPTYNNPDNSGCEPPAEPITVARIVTEEEKPALIVKPQYCIHCAGEVIEARYNSSVVYKFCSSECTIQYHRKQNQAAPVVDKPDFMKIVDDMAEALFKLMSGLAKDGVALEGFVDAWNAHHNYITNRLQESFNSYLLKQRGQPTEWIPVSTRLPEHLDKVLVTFEGSDNILMASFQILMGKGPAFMPYFADGRKLTDRVITHWAALPEPPKLRRKSDESTFR